MSEKRKGKRKRDEVEREREYGIREHFLEGIDDLSGKVDLMVALLINVVLKDLLGLSDELA